MKRLNNFIAFAFLLMTISGCSQVTDSQGTDSQVTDSQVTDNGLSVDEVIKLTATDGAADDFFGKSVSLSSDGTTALISSYGDGDKSGSAYIFIYNGSGWSQKAKLTASDGAAEDHFGISVSLSSDGSIALIGASGDNTYSGSAYIFSGANWGTETKLTATDGATTDSFGFAVSLSSDGTTALIGSSGDDDLGSSSGSAYIFSGANWSTKTKLTASDGSASDYFGISVSLSSDGSSVLIGAYKDDDLGSSSGSAYIFSGANWGTETKLTASDGAGSDKFGVSVSLSSNGSTALIGAEGDYTYSGSAYIFSGSNWSDETKLTTYGTDYFGNSVSLSSDGSIALIGSYKDDNNYGSAFIFSGANWGTETKLTASDGASSDFYGYSVSLSSDGNSALIGSYGDDDKGSSSGSVYAY